jgi:murein DD-endopeptidase MepM/ murein hydrolase activator NlpD
MWRHLGDFVRPADPTAALRVVPLASHACPCERIPMPRPPHARATIVVVAIACLGCDGSPPADAAPESATPLAAALDVPAPSTVDPDVDPFVAAELEGLRGGLRLQWPVENVHITSTFGWRADPLAGGTMRMHRGLDFRGETGDLVLSIGEGTIAFTGHDPALGNMVIVDHGDRVTSIYGHLSDVLVHEGVPVQRGAAIGLVGNTGQSEAPHLHLTIKLGDEAVDPLLLLGQPLHAPDAIVVPTPAPTAPAPEATPPPPAP